MFRIIPQGQQEWLRLLFRWLIALAVLLEVGWFFVPNLHPDLDRYRFQERRKALANWGRQQTPESGALWKAEMHLLNAHLGQRALLELATFLAADGLAIWFYWNHGYKKASA